MKKVTLTIKYIILILLSLIFLFPIIYMLANSVMSSAEISSAYNTAKEGYMTFKLIPKQFTLEQFYDVFFKAPDFLNMFWNSVISTLPTVIGQVAVSSLAAFAFGKLNFPGRDKIFFFYMVLLILPIQVTLVPNYILLRDMNLLNNFLAIILPGTFSAFGICLLRQSIRYIPYETIEAAFVEGASHIRVFFKIILPQIKGSLITLIILVFIDNWNIIEQPLIYFTDTQKFPLSLGLSLLGDGSNGIVFACSVLFMMPALIVYFLGQKHFSSPFARN